MNKSNSIEILELVRNTIGSKENSTARLSAIIRSCIRIARLRDDYFNLFWLQLEIIDQKNSFERTRALTQIQMHYSKEEYDKINTMFGEMWMEERPAIDVNDKGVILYPKDKFLIRSVCEIESELDAFRRDYKDANTPNGMHPLDTYMVDTSHFQLRSIFQAKIVHYEKILENIKNRVYDFLSLTEIQILYGQFHSDFFEQNRLYVEKRLAELCPEVLKELVASISNLDKKTPEVWAQALLSSRRLLEDLANFLYPARIEPVKDSGGKEHALDEKKYINRLWQFVSDSYERKTSGDLLKAAIQDIGHRIDYLYGLASKGTHKNVGDFEVNQCLMQIYILTGDLIRIYDKTSTIGKIEEVQ